MLARVGMCISYQWKIRANWRSHDRINYDNVANVKRNPPLVFALGVRRGRNRVGCRGGSCRPLCLYGRIGASIGSETGMHKWQIFQQLWQQFKWKRQKICCHFGDSVPLLPPQSDPVWVWHLQLDPDAARNMKIIQWQWRFMVGYKHGPRWRPSPY